MIKLNEDDKNQKALSAADDNIQAQSPEESREPDQRREALRRVLVGGGVISSAALIPEKWTNTVLESVVLPAHAQTSGITSGIFSGGGGGP